MYANRSQIVLGDACLEITREPVAENATELIPKFHISGVVPTPYIQKPGSPNDQYWVYRFNSITVIRIYISDGRAFEIELQEVSNQPTWSNGTISDLQTATEDINAWLVSDAPPPVLETYVFRTLSLNLAGVPPMDGARFLEFEGAGTLLGGWDGNVLAPTFDTHFTTSNLINFTNIATMPFPMHLFGYGVFNGGTEIWTWGGDGQLGANPVSRYTTAEGWVNINPDVSGTDFGPRRLYAPFKHVAGGVEYMYVMCGQSDDTGTIIYTDVVRASVLTPTIWEVVGSLPLGFYSAGTAVSINGRIVFCGGGRYVNGVFVAANTDVFHSLDDGASWSSVGTLPVEMQTLFPIIVEWDNKLWYNNGSTNSNQKGLWYSSNYGLSWTRLYDDPKESHARAMGVFNNRLCIVTGNLFNDSYEIYKVAYVKEIPSEISAFYSVRKHPLYSGPLLSVKVGVSTMDIGAVGDDLDTASLLSFVGSGTASVKFYDQVGSNHQQNYSGFIVNGGTLITQNGKPAVFYNDEPITVSSTSIGTNYLLSIVGNIVSPAREIYGGGPNVYGIYQQGGLISHNTGGGSGSVSVSFDYNIQTIVQLFRRNLIVQIYQNGTNNGNINSIQLSGNGTFTYTSLSGEGTPYDFGGYIQEMSVASTNILDKKYGYEQNVRDYFNF